MYRATSGSLKRADKDDEVASPSYPNPPQPSGAANRIIDSDSASRVAHGLVRRLLNQGTVLIAVPMDATDLPPLAESPMTESDSNSELEVDRQFHRVVWEGTPVRISEREFQLLSALSERPLRAWSFTELLGKGWGMNYSSHDADLVRTAVKRLRKKLVGVGATNIIVSVPGFGFSLAPQNA